MQESQWLHNIHGDGMKDETKQVDMRRHDDKEVVKEAIKEWLDDRVKEFGWFSLKTLLAAAVSAVVWLAWHTKGFK